MNTSEDWDTGWGGQTVVLDDDGKLDPASSPSFDEFSSEFEAETTDNRSLLFGSRGDSWHGVRKINCPDDAYRKVFIVVFEEHRPWRMAFKRFKRLLKGEPLTTHKESLMS